MLFDKVIYVSPIILKEDKHPNRETIQIFGKSLEKQYVLLFSEYRYKVLQTRK